MTLWQCILEPPDASAHLDSVVSKGLRRWASKAQAAYFASQRL